MSQFVFPSFSSLDIYLWRAIKCNNYIYNKNDMKRNDITTLYVIIIVCVSVMAPTTKDCASSGLAYCLVREFCLLANCN